jgi:hypothetical protein
MTRIAILLIILNGLAFTSHSQMKGGLKAGANFSGIIVSKTDDVLNNDYSSRISFHAGSYLQQAFSDHLLWQVELLFSNKGYKCEVEGQTVNVSLNYLNWPILLVYRPFNIFEFEFGPELGYMISGEEMLNSFDLGFAFGTRVNISNKLNAGLRYSYGLPFKMDLEGTSSEGTDITYQNSVFQIYLGFNLINE